MAITTNGGQDLVPENGLCVVTKRWNDLRGVDETTYETAKKIQSIAIGLTPKQFTEALSLALDSVSRYSILSSLPDLPSTGQDL